MPRLAPLLLIVGFLMVPACRCEQARRPPPARRPAPPVPAAPDASRLEPPRPDPADAGPPDAGPSRARSGAADAGVTPAPASASPRIAVSRNGVGLDVDLFRVDVRVALEALGRAAGRNLVLLGEVSGTVTLQLRNVPARLAIQAAAAAAACVAEDRGDLIVVRRPAP